MKKMFYALLFLASAPLFCMESEEMSISQEEDPMEIEPTTLFAQEELEETLPAPSEGFDATQTFKQQMATYRDNVRAGMAGPYRAGQLQALGRFYSAAKAQIDQHDAKEVRNLSAQHARYIDLGRDALNELVAKLNQLEVAMAALELRKSKYDRTIYEKATQYTQEFNMLKPILETSKYKDQLLRAQTLLSEIIRNLRTN